jgi:hypothetical protein
MLLLNIILLALVTKLLKATSAKEQHKKYKHATLFIASFANKFLIVEMLKGIVIIYRSQALVINSC